MAKLESEGLMTDFGRAKVEAAKKSGQWDAVKQDIVTDDHIADFEAMLRPFQAAYDNFMGMSKSARKAYVGSYLFGAKTGAGKKKRFTTIVARLNLNSNPMESMASHNASKP